MTDAERFFEESKGADEPAPWGEQQGMVDALEGTYEPDEPPEPYDEPADDDEPEGYDDEYDRYAEEERDLGLMSDWR